MHAAAPLQPGVWFQLGIADARSLELIGDIGLLLSANGHHAEVGFTLARPAQGQGLATAAVREAVALVFECSAAGRVWLPRTRAPRPSACSAHRYKRLSRKTTFRGGRASKSLTPSRACLMKGGVNRRGSE
jgi:aminoglycoside 6'-N-acetyltransferase